MIEKLSIIIPALNAASVLGPTLAALSDAMAGGAEVIVVDGGSGDATRDIAEAGGARVMSAPTGRGAQLDAGAGAAAGDWLLFLHADTIPAPGWRRAVEGFAADAANRNRAAVFQFALDDHRPAARRLETLVRWRCRLLALPYGDQGLLISKRFFDAMGGFRPLVLFEDVDIVRRIGRARITVLAHKAVTSAERYRRAGYLARPARNLLCLALYYLGAPQALLRRIYG